MPIYEYAPTSPGTGCEHCAEGLEVLARISDPDLSCCPHCGTDLQRRISAPNVVAGTAHMMKESHYAERGFTQYKKIGKGVYEKAGGKGPRYIADDGK